MAAREMALDLAIRPRPASSRVPAEPAPFLAAPTPLAAGVLPPATEVPAAERAGGLVGASATSPDVVSRAKMSVALQQTMGNSRMGAMSAAPAGDLAAPAKPTAKPASAPPILTPSPAVVRAADTATKPAPVIPIRTAPEPAPMPAVAAPKPAPTPPTPPALDAPAHTPRKRGIHSKGTAAPQGGEPSGEAAEPSAGEGPIHAGKPAAGARLTLVKSAKGEKAKGGDDGGEAADTEGKGAAKAGAKTARTVPIKMPEAPAELSPAASARVGAAQSAAGYAAVAQSALPPAADQVGDARGAVTEPSEEANARAASDLVTALGQRPAPSPEIEELCKKIYDVIRAKRPPDEESLVKADPEDMGKAAGTEMDASVQGGVAKVDQGYQSLDEQPQGTPGQQGQPIPPAPDAAATPPINASQAQPDAVPAKNVDLNADAADSKARMDEAGMNSDPAKLVQTGPIAEARDAQDGLEKAAAEDPAKVLADQQATLLKAGSDLASLQKAALASLNTSRKATVSHTSGQQSQMVGSEVDMRTKASADAQAIFTAAQTQVNALLQPLPQTAKSKWDAGVKLATTKFKQRLKKVEDWIKERHSGGWGTVVSLWDDVTGLPGWVTDEYDAAEQTFGDEICATARAISTDVNGIILTCETLIANARSQIAAVFAALPANLQAWAAGEQGKLGEKLDGLAKHAHEVRDNFNKELIKSASETVQDVRQQVHALREKAKGLIGRVMDAIGRFLDDPAKFLIEALLDLLGIPPSAFWAVVNKIKKVINDIADDPLKFATNLMAAVGKGFSQFFDRILDHLLHGFIDWLTGGLASTGVTIPKDTSLKSILTFLLQLMGITWPRIRKLLVKHIGEKNVALVEKVYSLVSTLIELGPEGVFELIKEKLNPKHILDMIIQAAVDYMIKAVVKAVTARILLLFNPVGAILQALEAIYRVLKWIFTNAAKIFRLVETVVNGVADILAGNIGGMANAVEGALAGLIPPVIDFLADYLGFGDLPVAIRDTIVGFQDMVMEVLDSALGWLIEKGKALLAAVGLGGKDKDKKGEPADVGQKVPFTAEGESHNLWIKVEGTNAVLWVASDKPMTIEDRLDEWAVRATKLDDKKGEGGESPRAKAQGLIAQARPLVSVTDKTAEDIVRKSQAANEVKEGATPAAPSDAAQGVLSDEEHQLADILRQLFELFGESYTKPSEKWKGKIEKAESFAQKWMKEELDANEQEVRAFKTWNEVRAWLDLRPAFADPLGGPLEAGFWEIVADSSETVKLGKGQGFVDPRFFGQLEKQELASAVAAGEAGNLRGRLLKALFGGSLNAAAIVKAFLRDIPSAKISDETTAGASPYHGWGKFDNGELKYAFPKHVSWKDSDLSGVAWNLQKHHIWPRYLMGPDELVPIHQKLHIVHFHAETEEPAFPFPGMSGVARRKDSVKAWYRTFQATGTENIAVAAMQAGLWAVYNTFQSRAVVSGSFAAHCIGRINAVQKRDLK